MHPYAKDAVRFRYGDLQIERKEAEEDGRRKKERKKTRKEEERTRRKREREKERQKEREKEEREGERERRGTTGSIRPVARATDLFFSRDRGLEESTV